MASSSVRVYVRVRPFNKRELGIGNLRHPITLSGNDVIIEERNKSYQFDHCFGPKAQQDEVFDVVGKKVCSDFLRGFNATQFVYGQTGAGKTWTMMGNEENRGIIPRSSALVFEEIAARPDGWSFEIDASYLEIYMEKVNDLLDAEKVNLNIKEDKLMGVYVEHLTKESIGSLEEVYDLLKRGDKVRKVAATAMNAGSSRSHSVLTIYLQQTNPEGVKTTSKLNLVDLAGSERLDKTGAEGLTQKQGALINLSLTTLSQVISGLSKTQEGGKAIIPFRGSKLTRLLQTSLSGNSKTGLSIHLSPHEDNLDESIGTCEFGKRAKMIKTKAKAVVQKSAAQLEKEIDHLKKQIAKLQKFMKSLDESGGGGGGGGAKPATGKEKAKKEKKEKVKKEKVKKEKVKKEAPKKEAPKQAEAAKAPAAATPQPEQGSPDAPSAKEEAKEKEEASHPPDEHREPEEAEEHEEPEEPESEESEHDDEHDDHDEHEEHEEHHDDDHDDHDDHDEGHVDLEADKVDLEEFDEEQEKLADLEQDKMLLMEENQNLVAEVASLEKQFQAEVDRETTLRDDYKAKEEEIKKLENALEQMEGDLAKESKEDSAKPMDAGKHSQEVQELTKIVNDQRERLNRERDENRALKKENTELSDELTEKTRRLAMAELQVMRYDTEARNKNKNTKIKVKITPQRANPGQQWQDILDDDNANSGLVSAGAGVDLVEKRDGTALQKFGKLDPIPVEELKGGRSGYMFERLHKKNEFARRFFVVQDSFLLCYDNDASPSCQPRYIIPVMDSKVGGCPKQGDQEFCMMVLCGQYFNVLATESEAEKTAWLDELGLARFATHETLTELAFFNRHAIDAVAAERDKGKLAGLVQQAEYAPLGAKDYALSVPITGGIEGFLHSTGFSLLNEEENDKVQKVWGLLYCVVKDSYLLAFDLNRNDLMTEPVGLMHLGGKAEIIKQHVESDDGQKKCYFCVVNTHNNSESITFHCESEDLRDRWIRALNMAALVTLKNVMVASIHKESIAIKAGVAVTPEKDLVGRFLDPLCEQAYDDAARPLYRHPDGRVLNKDMEPVGVKVPRFGKDRKPLDGYNRPLPEGAKPMFAVMPTEPVGVGLDGGHYAYPSGRKLTLEDEHYDAQGNRLPLDVVKAADAILPRLRVAVTARMATLRREKHEVFDAFGRAVRRLRQGVWVDADGYKLAETAPLFDVLGKPLQVAFNDGPGDTQPLTVQYLSHDNKATKLGSVAIETKHTSLLEVHNEIKKQLKGLTDAKVSRVTFLDHGQPIPDHEREARLASSLLPSVVVVCKDIQGKSVAFNGEFKLRIDHDEVDAALAKDKETDFLKQVGLQKRKRSPQ